ncbi:putative signal transduction protein with CBS domains [Candidatus Nitrososphaera gargensis Ga9.2]|uniref:Putative signal transduction protein with CBS domains n=1 Tax=Nitrososphaera gargensis (strain Ga9.2) TaxID=1237085 RepID=K0IHV1_NITGG|nr:CBS domain-containing protein [Candidatus Nitrososphaera gargensis]AFU57467.1 putative signal transduction protein with CBS domains [Candidatus Nitrososphaera gargensis Ga9.2]
MSRKPTGTTTRKNTSISEIMSDRLETINLLGSAKDAAIMMTNRNVSSLLVVDDDRKAVGIITERDLVRRVCTKDIPSRLVTIQNVISAPLKTVPAKTPIDKVADIMVRNKIRHVVVVTDEADKQEPVGIVSATDIVAFVRENSETMAQITREVMEALEREAA